MRKLAALFAPALLLLTATSQDSQPVETLDRSKLVQTFAEEFDRPPSFYDPQTAPNGRWKTNFAFGVQQPDDARAWEARTLRPNKELQYYGDPLRGTGSFEWRGGELIIVGKRNPHRSNRRTNALPYLSGLITTQPSFEQTYGYFEARITMPVGKGLWPAFWMLPRFQPGLDRQPPAEVDVVENIGARDEIYATVHYGSHPKPDQDGQRIAVEHVDQPHTYGVMITKDEIRWYVDDRQVRRAPNRDFHGPAYMLLNLAIGGEWPGAPDDTTPFPAQMKIDWVRAYAFRPGTAP